MRALALTAGLAAAALVPGEPLGVAVPLIAALMLAAAAVALRASRLRLAFGVLALVLAAQATLLDAGWIVAIDLAAAWLLATLAAAGPVLAALVAPLVRLRDAPALVPAPSERHELAVRGAVLGVLVTAPFLLLFLSADAAFAGLVEDIPLPDDASVPPRVAIFVLVLIATVGLGLAARADLSKFSCAVPRALSPAEWAVPLVLLDLLFAAFVTVQLAVLFGGHDRVLRTEGLTYAEYARSGFWQLLTASALTFAVVGGALRYARPRTPRGRAALRSLLTALCGLTLVVLVSALQRLRLYEDAFGLTRSRLLAEAIAVWLGVLLLILVIAVWAPRARARLVAAGVLVTGLGLLVFSLANPDLRVAERNVERWLSTGRLDVSYVARLSADATPALVELPEPERSRATARIRAELAEPEPWSSANRSRSRARELLGL